MTNKKISELTPTGSPGVNDIIPIVQGGVNKQAELGDLPISTATQTALDGKQNTSEKGQVNGYASLDGSGQVPVSQLPSITAGVSSVNGQSGTVVVTQDDILDGTTYKQYSQTEKTKLAGIEANAEVNNISDINATDLTDGGDTTLHTHDGRYYTETESDLRYEPIKGSDDNYVTDAEKIVIGNTSGTNTGDETTATIKSKLGITTLSGSNTGDQDLSGLVPKTTTITINGIPQDLSTNRSWTIGGGGGGGSLNYISVTSNQSASPSNFYGVNCTTSDITLTLTNGTTIGDILSIKKLDNSGYSLIINGNIELDGSITMGIQYESIDLYWNGTYYLIK